MSNKKAKSLGEIIKETMKERGIKGSVVARKMNVSRQTINQIDTRKKFDIAFLQSLKDASGLDFTYYAYKDIMDSMSDDSKLKYLESSPRITINISISTKKDNLNNLPELVTQIEDLSRKLGFELV
ncbi:helix-turn-helix domain-containing protein [Olivibacter sitiensis]|uniref:helix-turn-helix domain-containing protein n=1 Tax=Olivibacter sitiensis TaxID=376470 RepID=UPI000410116C|nr:helix-turn-helix transcriptional regulator [Olivibacter sitiensis]